MNGPRAAVDVGSNSVRLLVVDADGRRVTRRMEITRLARGVDETGHLDDGSLEHTLDTLERFQQLWRKHGADGRVRIAATSAVRDAADRERFFTGVLARTGIEALVLTGDEEARYAFSGALGSVDADRPAAVVDVGGGSTEVIVGDIRGKATASVSLQLGCVRLAERCLRSDPPTAGEVGTARAELRVQLERMEATLDGSGASLEAARSLVAVAGTATTLAGIHLGLDHYDESRIHGTRVPLGALHELTDHLLSLDTPHRSMIGCVQPGREDVIHAGALILTAVADAGAFDSVVVSEADGLDGLAASID